MISNSNTNKTEELFSFRGKEFTCTQATINQLNFALTFNMSRERYIKVTK